MRATSVVFASLPSSAPPDILRARYVSPTGAAFVLSQSPGPAHPRAFAEHSGVWSFGDVRFRWSSVVHVDQVDANASVPLHLSGNLRNADGELVFVEVDGDLSFRQALMVALSLARSSRQS